MSIDKFTKQVNEADLEVNVISSEIFSLKDKNDEKSINYSEKLNSDLMVKSQLVTNTR